ncbi:MAG: tRNA-guanine transglycosylase, partial [Polyangiales bacterium]
ARCDCPVCTRFSRAYLRHLIHAEEMLGPRLITQHNLWFYASLMRHARQAILEHRFEQFARDTEQRMLELDEVGPVVAVAHDAER